MDLGMPFLINPFVRSPRWSFFSGRVIIICSSQQTNPDVVDPRGGSWEPRGRIALIYSSPSSNRTKKKNNRRFCFFSFFFSFQFPLHGSSAGSRVITALRNVCGRTSGGQLPCKHIQMRGNTSTDSFNQHDTKHVRQNKSTVINFYKISSHDAKKV